MEQWTRRAALTAVTAAGAAALIGAAPPQRGRRNVPSAPVLEIGTGEDAFTAPARTVAGAVTLRVRNTSPRTGTVGVVRLHPGVTEEQFRTRLRALFTAEAPADVIHASRVMMATATQLGGASHHSGIVADATVTLAPGRHLLLEYLDFMPGIGRGPAPGAEYVRPLTVTADGPGGRAPVPCGTLTAHENASKRATVHAAGPGARRPAVAVRQRHAGTGRRGTAVPGARRRGHRGGHRGVLRR